MRVAMLGRNYRYAYAPVSANGRGYVTAGVGCYLGQDSTTTEPIPILSRIMPVEAQVALWNAVPDTVAAITGNTSLTEAEKQAQLTKLAKDQGIQVGTWFERNQTIVVGGVVLALVAFVAVQTTKRRRR